VSQQIEEKSINQESSREGVLAHVQESAGHVSAEESGGWARKSWRETPREESRRGWRRGLS